MAQCGRVKRCTLTDVVPATLDNLHDNVAKLPPSAAPCRVASLDWCAPRAFLDTEERAPDLNPNPDPDLDPDPDPNPNPNPNPRTSDTVTACLTL